MEPSPTSRREFVSLSGTVAAMILGVRPETLRRAFEAMDAAREGQELQFEHFTPERAADLEAIAAQIIPTDDLPGAREARVVVFMDRTFGDLPQPARDDLWAGLDALNRQATERAGTAVRFAQLSDEDQHALLVEIEAQPFFQQVRANTIIGMFAHPKWGGNYDGAGWQVLGFEPRFVWSPPFGAYDAEVHR